MSIASFKTIVVSITGVILIYFLSWHFAFKKTITVLNNYLELLEANKNGDDPERTYLMLSKRLTMLDSFIENDSITDGEIRQNILELISKPDDDNNYIISVPRQHIYNRGSLRIILNNFLLTGDYFNLLKLLYDIDTSTNSPKIASVKFYTFKHVLASQENLYMSVYFQSISRTYDKKN